MQIVFYLEENLCFFDLNEVNSSIFLYVKVSKKITGVNMPLAVNEKNLKQVFESHLQPGEKSLAFVMAGARGVLGLTSNNRVIHSNFPFFGKAKILDEYYVSDIFSAQCSQTSAHTMMISIDAKGEKKKYKSTITPFVDSKAMANELIKIITEKNGNARPSYLDADEKVIENLPCKSASYTVTDKNLIKLNKSGDIV